MHARGKNSLTIGMQMALTMAAASLPSCGRVSQVERLPGGGPSAAWTGDQSFGLSAENDALAAAMLMREFPERIEGARSVKKYPEKGSKWIFVHIRQRHWAPRDEFVAEWLCGSKACREDAFSELAFRTKTGQLAALSEDEALRCADVISCQRNIIKIMRSLGGQPCVLSETNGGYSEIMIELRTLRHDLRNQSYKYAAGVERDSSVAAEPLPQEEKDACLKLLTQYISYYEAETDNSMIRDPRISAAEVLEKAGEIVLFPSGTLESHRQRAEEVKARRGEGAGNLIGPANESAESLLISLANQARESANRRCAFVLFGASHSFRKNIKEWNNAHPDQSCALVEITPGS